MNLRIRARRDVLRQSPLATKTFSMIGDQENGNKLIRKMPTADQVAEWVKQSKSLARVIEY